MSLYFTGVFIILCDEDGCEAWNDEILSKLAAQVTASRFLTQKKYASNTRYMTIMS